MTSPGYTDDPFERCGETIDDGLDRLADTAAHWFERGMSAAETADGLLRELLPGRPTTTSFSSSSASSSVTH